MTETKVEYLVNNNKLEPIHQAIYHVLKEDRVIIAYRPSWREVTGSVNATILLQQIKFRWDTNGRKPFYKFFQPATSHRAYKPGDSLTEELGFTISELRGALEKVGKRLGKEDLQDLGKSLDRVFFGYFTDQQHLTWFYFNERYFNSQMVNHYTNFPNQESLPGNFPNQDSLLGRIRNPDSAESGFLTSIHTETTTETTSESAHSDFLDTVFTGSASGVSEQTAANPDDQWIAYRNPVIKSYADKTGVKLNQEQKGELGLLAGQDNFDKQVFDAYLSEFAGRGGYAYDVKAFCDGYSVYRQTGDIYRAMGRKKNDPQPASQFPELNVQVLPDGRKVVW